MPPALEPPRGLDPLPLPRFTFLCSPSFKENCEFAQELMNLDPGLLAEDFEAPIRRAIIELLHCGDHTKDLLAAPLSEEEAYIHSCLLGAIHERNWEWLGQIAVKELQNGGGPIFDRYLFRDAIDPFRVRPFAAEFGGPACLCIHFSSLSVDGANYGTDVRHIWLPHPDPSRRLSDLRFELIGEKA